MKVVALASAVMPVTILVATHSAAALMRSRRRKRMSANGISYFGFAVRSVFRIEAISATPPAPAARKKSMARPG